MVGMHHKAGIRLMFWPCSKVKKIWHLKYGCRMDNPTDKMLIRSALTIYPYSFGDKMFILQNLQSNSEANSPRRPALSLRLQLQLSALYPSSAAKNSNRKDRKERTAPNTRPVNSRLTPNMKITGSSGVFSSWN